ncbi:MAG: MerR family transcriptional regulator, partial [Betaproteobacteria bacterium]
MEKTDTSSRNSGLRQASAVSAAVLPAESMLSISAVERDTGLSKDVLRMWERRYRFPSPLRDKHGERIYPHDQIAKLRAVKRLMDRGYRPGKIIGLHLDDLNALGTAPAGALEHSTEIQEVLSLIRGHQLQELRQRLNQMLMKQGLLRFVVETVAPLTTAVGEAWVRGEFAVFEEHLYTEQIQGLLRNANTSPQAHSTSPRLLLTSFPTDPHHLGLLMVEAALVVEGATCIPLGTETPAPEIVRAASAHRADIVALSFSAAFPERLAASG